MSYKKYLFATKIQWFKIPSKNQTKVFYLSNQNGQFDVWVLDLVTQTSEKVLTRPGGILFFSVDPFGQKIYFLDDSKGSEKGHFVGYDIVSHIYTDLTPEVKDYFAFGLEWNLDQTAFAFLASNENENFVMIGRDGYTQQVEVSKYELGMPYVVWVDQNKLVYAKKNDENVWQIVLLDIITNTKTYFCELKDCPFLQLMDNEGRVVFLAKSEGRYLPYVLDLDTAKSTILSEALSAKGDYFVLDYDQGRYLLSHLIEAESTMYVLDINDNKLSQIENMEGNLPLFYGGAKFVEKGEKILTILENFNSPGGIWQYDFQTKNIPQIILGSTKEKLVDWKKVSFLSEDGAKVWGWYALPKNHKDGTAVPFVIDIHGGPQAVVSREYNAEGNVWLDLGYGFASVNYRGSIGFGKEFEEYIYKDIGFYESMDVVAMKNFLVQSGLAVSEKVFLTGWSWGGYVVLYTLGTKPGVFAGGICGMGIADFVQQYEEETASFRSQDQVYFGGTPDEKLAQYQKSSPISYVNQFQNPVLVIHGKNDARCPAGQMRNFVNLMKKQGKTIEEMWLDCGHEGVYTDNQVRYEVMQKMVKFVQENS